MLSVASVSSAGGAANYFAKDDYYVGDGPAELSEWGGKGAEVLGLSGPVSKEDFEKVLDGKLPDGTVVNGHEKRQSGTDLTFSMPKSASLLAQLGGDQRILAAQHDAVKATMAYLEKRFAETRDYSRNSKGEPPNAPSARRPNARVTIAIGRSLGRSATPGRSAENDELKPV